jgi:hypothetical protein
MCAMGVVADKVEPEGECMVEGMEVLTGGGAASDAAEADGVEAAEDMAEAAAGEDGTSTMPTGGVLACALKNSWNSGLRHTRSSRASCGCMETAQKRGERCRLGQSEASFLPAAV